MDIISNDAHIEAYKCDYLDKYKIELLYMLTGKKFSQSDIKCIRDDFVSPLELLRLNFNIVKKRQLALLKDYKYHGKGLNLKETEYFKAYRGFLAEHSSSQVLRRVHDFLKLYEEIAVHGFRETKDPVTAVDLQPFEIKKIDTDYFTGYLDSHKKVKLNYLRLDGCHRSTIAFMLGFKTIPVKVVCF